MVWPLTYLYFNNVSFLLFLCISLAAKDLDFLTLVKSMIPMLWVLWHLLVWPLGHDQIWFMSLFDRPWIIILTSTFLVMSEPVIGLRIVLISFYRCPHQGKDWDLTIYLKNFIWRRWWKSDNTLASHLWGWGSSGKAGRCLPLVGSLQYRTLTICMYNAMHVHTYSWSPWKYNYWFKENQLSVLK